MIITLNFRSLLKMFLVAILLDSLIFIYGVQIGFAQSLSPPQSSVVNVITTSNDSHPTTRIWHAYNTAWQSVLITIMDEVGFHYPTPQEKGKLDKIVNQTLSMLQPIGRAINESHRCILEAVICGSGNMTNGTTLRF
jgi:hypothetical protein